MKKNKVVVWKFSSHYWAMTIIWSNGKRLVFTAFKTKYAAEKAGKLLFGAITGESKKNTTNGCVEKDARNNLWQYVVEN